MKITFNFSIALLFIFAFSGANSQAIARVESIKIQSKILKQDREILIYTPIDYDWRVNEYFDVIYVFDSQNREFFDYTSSIIPFLPNGGKSFIVVGITSPFDEKNDYGRNNDLLPRLFSEDSKKRYGKYSGNADNFLEYVTNEVMPLVDQKYRTLKNNIALGHSLSASFILYSLVNKPNLFSSYITISPNLAYDEEVLANKLITMDFSKISKKTYLYLSNADEGIDYWKEWKPAREKVYYFLKSNLKNEDIFVAIESFPANDHLNSFPPSVNKALDYYFKNVVKEQESQLSSDFIETTIRLKVKDKEEKIYITGNQKNLGDWIPDAVEMRKVSEFEREIVLKLQSPAQFKFTNGSWESELQVSGTYGKITIKPEVKKMHTFEIIEN